MKIMEREVMQSSVILENENDTNCLHDNAIDHKLTRGLDDEKPINVDERFQKKVHQFYFIKYWPYEDQTLKSRIQEAQKLYKRINLEAWALADAFTERLLDQRNALTELRCLRSHNTAYTLDWTLNKLNQFQKALDKLYSARYTYQRRGTRSCSSGERLNSMLHGTKNLATERKLLREINERQRKGASDSFSPVVELRSLFQWLRSEMQWQNNNEDRNKKILYMIEQIEKMAEKAIANATQKGIIWNPLDTKKAIQAQIRYMIKISEELRKEHLEVKGKIKCLEKDLEIAEKDISNFRKEFNDVKQTRAERNRRILNLQRQQDEEKGRYCRYASISSNGRELARKKNVKALQELSLREVDIFMFQWSTSKAFRYNYERSILPSLESRGLSRDGRMWNLNEQPLHF